MTGGLRACAGVSNVAELCEGDELVREVEGRRCYPRGGVGESVVGSFCEGCKWFQPTGAWLFVTRGKGLFSRIVLFAR